MSGPGYTVDRAPGARCDAVYKGYIGKQRYRVSHEGLRPLVVAAPDEQSAIVAYADAHGMDWTRYDFYAYCLVEKI